jgi:hypothetical protein
MVRLKIKVNDNLRLHIFLFSDYELFGRVCKSLYCIGEFAFRELLVFFDRTDFKNVAGVESLSHNLNVSSMITLIEN